MYNTFFWNNEGKIKTFAVIGEESAEESANKNFMAGLRHTLVYYKKIGKYFIIFNCALGDAIGLAKGYADSFFFGDLRSEKSTLTFYKSKNNEVTYKPINFAPSFKYAEDAELFFKSLGYELKFSLNDFASDIPLVKNEAEFAESLKEDRTFKSRALHRSEAYKD